MSITLLPIILASFVCVVCASFEQSNEGSEFYVGFFHNRFGLRDNTEKILPFLWITTKETTKVKFTVSTINGTIFSGIARPQKITNVTVSTEMIVSDSTPSEWFKGIHIKTKKGKKIVVFGQNEEEGSNDAYLALPVVTLPEGRSHEYIVASIKGDSGTAEQAKDSVALIIGTENDTKIVIKPSVTILNHFAPFHRFIPVASDSFNTITIQRFQTVYLQVRGGDISGTRITSNKPISVFSGHECADVPLTSEPCDMLIEQIPPIDTWGSEVVTIPLKTKDGDIIKVIASQDATRVNVTHTNIDDGTMTKHDTFNLNAGQFKELLIKDFSLIQSDNPIAVFQFARSFKADYVLTSDPLMLLVPPYEQYCNGYAVATAPFEPSLTQTVEGRVAYVNYTNIAVPAEFFNISSLIINNKKVNASEFKPIRRANESIWGYGTQLLLDEGAQVIRHHNPNAVLSVTIYGFSNQQSWGCTGGMGLAPVAVPRITTSNMMVFENDGTAMVEITRSGPLNSDVSVNITTVDGTALAGIDYTAVSQMVTFKSGQSVASINIPIKDDNIYEEPNITIRIVIVPNKDIIVLSSDSVVTIVDNDHTTTIKFNQSAYSIDEDNGSIKPVLLLKIPFFTDFTVQVLSFSKSAIGGIDYNSGPYTVIIPAGVDEVSFSILITNDNKKEENETFHLVIDPSSLPNHVNVGTPSQAIITIVDVTKCVQVKFSQPLYSTLESDGILYGSLVLSEPLQNIYRLRLKFISGNATRNEDFYGRSINVKFSPGTTVALFTIPIIKDKIFEGAEIFTIKLTRHNFAKQHNNIIKMGYPHTAIGQIIDEVTTIKFNQSTYSIDEDNGSIEPVLLLNIPAFSDFTVRVLSISKLASGGGIDYNSGPYTVIIPADVDEVSFSILITNDNKKEENETFHLVIDSSSLPDGVVVDTPSQAVITIVDVTPTIIKFNQSTYSIYEDNGSVKPVLLLNFPSFADFTIRVLSISKSASEGIDYNSGPYTVIIPANVDEVSFSILITNDNKKEKNETFHLVIDSSSLPDGVVVDTPSQAIITIVDVTKLTVSFNQLAYSVDEDAGAVWPALVLSDLSVTDVFVQVLTISGSASGGGIDYIAGPYTVKVPAGKVNASFRISITNDNKKEINETFRLIIDSSSLPDGVVVGSRGQALITIVDKTRTTVITPLPCDSVLRRIRPQLFTHCSCVYSTWSRWTRTGTSLLNNKCPSNNSIYEIRSRDVITGGSCTDTQEMRSVCEPTLEQKATILISALNLGLPASFPVAPPSTNESISRRSTYCNPVSKELFCSSEPRQKRNLLVQENTFQSDHVFDGETPSLEKSYDNSTPLPFDLKEYLSDINIHRQRRRSEAVKRYVLFVLDTSGSIRDDNFKKMLHVVSELVPLFCGNISFAIMTFGNIIKQEICFDCRMKDNDIAPFIQSIVYRDGSKTRTGKAAKCACTEMLTSNCGYEIPRGSHIFTDVIFITDGYSNGDLDVCKETECFEQDIKNHYNSLSRDTILDMYVFAIGIGRPKYEELSCIVGNLTTLRSEFSVGSFYEFEQLKNQTVIQLANNTIKCFEP